MRITRPRVQVSGPVAAIEKFVAQLDAEGVFVRRVKSAGVAFHSKYIAAAAPLLRRSLERVIPQGRPRSARWVSSSLPRDQWGSEIGKWPAGDDRRHGRPELADAAALVRSEAERRGVPREQPAVAGAVQRRAERGAGRRRRGRGGAARAALGRAAAGAACGDARASGAPRQPRPGAPPAGGHRQVRVGRRRPRCGRRRL